MTLMHRLTLTVLAALFTITASAEPGTVLVIPARQALVNLGLAVGDQFSRELEVVAYHDKTAVSAGGLFVWDRMNWNWRSGIGAAQGLDFAEEVDFLAITEAPY